MYREVPPSYDQINAPSAPGNEKRLNYTDQPITANPSFQQNSNLPMNNYSPGQSQNPQMMSTATPQNSFPPMASSNVQVSLQPIISAPAPTVVTMGTSTVPGACPVCHSTRGFGTGFTCCGYLWCICCFPCGIICCLMCNRIKTCRNCNFGTH